MSKVEKPESSNKKTPRRKSAKKANQPNDPFFRDLERVFKKHGWSGEAIEMTATDVQASFNRCPPGYREVVVRKGNSTMVHCIPPNHPAPSEGAPNDE